MNNGSDTAMPPHIDASAAVPINPALVSALQDMINRARRGEITSLIGACARSQDGATFEVINIADPVGAMLVMGSIQVTVTKIANGLIQSQQQPPSRIMRASGPVPTMAG